MKISFKLTVCLTIMLFLPVMAMAQNTVSVSPSQVGSLKSIISAAQAGSTILFADGTYNLNGDNLWISKSGLTIRSASGNREAVILDGQYVTNSVIQIVASDVTVQDLTIKRSKHHPIHVMATTSEDVLNTLINNVHIIDPGQQAIKINQNSAKTRFADNGVISNCRIEMTDAGRRKVLELNGSCYTGGVDGHQARDWEIRDNEIEGFWCSEGLSEYGVHFWTGSRDTVVSNNRLIDNARGIGFGMGQSGTWRTYSDNPCPGANSAGHYGGTVCNNIIIQKSEALRSSQMRFESAISLEQACGTKVFHNTIVSTDKPNISSLEWRFSNTNVQIVNNLLSHNMKARDGAVAELSGNLENAPLSMFANVSGGDLHLLESATDAIGKGVSIAEVMCGEDIDGDTRDAATPDIGADERAGDTTGPGDTPAPTNLRIREIIKQ